MTTVTIEVITPEVASNFLQKNYCNRPVSSSHVARLARTMEAGQFRHTHQGIAFDSNGNLVDGQHRLLAILASNTTQTLHVTRGIPTNSLSSIDCQSRPRTVSDSLAMEGSKHDRQVVALCRVWIRLLGKPLPAVHEIRQFLASHEPAIEFAVNVSAGNRILRNACVLAMLAIAYEAGYAEEIMGWAEIVKSGITSQPWQSSAIRFRDWWNSISHSAGESQRIESCHVTESMRRCWRGSSVAVWKSCLPDRQSIGLSLDSLISAD